MKEELTAEMIEEINAEILAEFGSGPTLEDLEAEELAAEIDDGAFDESPPEVASGEHPMYQIRLAYAAETFFAAVPPKGAEYQVKDHVIIPTKFGRDIAEIKGIARHPWGICHNNMVTIERKATKEELAKQKELESREPEANRVFQEKTAERNLDMKLAGVHFLFDESKVIFFFSADNRIDFRDLVVDLSSVFRMRIELRQISVRDEARICGALGLCGRPVCCRAVSDRLRPVTIRMAKEQNLSLNSMKISGQCGRLLCCLAFENNWYVESRKNLPPEGVELSYDGTDFRVTAANLITQTVQMNGADGRILEIPVARFSRNNGRWSIES
jgi:cell fate regulator YaaT (PSP1 superfamily)